MHLKYDNNGQILDRQSLREEEEEECPYLLNEGEVEDGIVQL